MDFNSQRVLGRTGLKVGRLGVGSSYGAPAEAFEEAFERGCNYFYWGSMRRTGMSQAIKNICRKGKRDQLIVVIQSYSRSAFLLEAFYRRALKLLALDHADILLLGWYKKKPPQRILKKVKTMKKRGMFRFLALSSHNRRLFPKLAKEDIFDIFHVRYSAAHRGAESQTFPYLEGKNRPGIVSYTATRWGQLLQKKNMPPGETAPAASDCYRFVLSHPAVDVCMTGPKNLQQMRQALKILDLGPLGDVELKRMRKIGDHIRG
ncbi:MAG: aldo/keto reductase [Syntrophobacterales bacterium]|jgi:aryl-alcohol dehydrogenase-like predicted oxidoreductase